MNSYKLKAKCFSAEAFVENAAIIKSELAKIRMAAASHLPLYLLESWILHWCNHFYLQWEGSTLEENVREK